MGIRMKIFILVAKLKIRFCGGVGVGKFMKKNIRGNCLKRGAWTVYTFKGGFTKKSGDVFDLWLIPNVHYV